MPSELRHGSTTDIGGIRHVLNEVSTAEEQAQANLTRRREETAAPPSLPNTAKLLEDNPLLLRLNLEALEKIANKVEKMTVQSFAKTLECGTHSRDLRESGR